MPNNDQTLTEKETAVINAFSSIKPELGAICASQQRFAIARRNILNNDKTGWADIVEEMSNEEIEAGINEGMSSNSFIYKHIGG